MKIIGKIKRIFLRRRTFLPLNKEEKINMEDLRESVKMIDLGNDLSLEWVRNQIKIKELILSGDIRDFLNWPIIMTTMFYGGNHHEFDALKKSPRWNSMYKNNLYEDKIGNPSRYTESLNSSSNLVHHFYSLEQLFVNIPSFDLKKINSIFEFGGGYGSFARLVLRLGFKGEYTIFDFKIFNLLQKYFIKSSSIKNMSKNVLYVNDIKNINGEFDLFVSLWALSESPLYLRDEILNKCIQSKYILIGYQDSFENNNNINYFNEIQSRYNNFKWIQYEIPHIVGNHYLIGYK